MSLRRAAAAAKSVPAKLQELLAAPAFKVPFKEEHISAVLWSFPYETLFFVIS